MSQEVSRKSKVDYKNGKIYIIRNSVNDLTYIGSTCQTLSQRMAQHRKEARRNKAYPMKLHALMTELKAESFYIELIEYCPCNTREELFKKEGEHIRAFKTELNSRIQGRNRKEYREDNREQERIKNKQYYENNKEHHLKQNKKYKEANKEYTKIRRQEHYENHKDEIKNRYLQNKDKINQKRRERMKLRKANDENFRQKLNRQYREWYAKKKESRQLKKEEEQPEQEPDN